jgi:hypothetical protein
LLFGGGDRPQSPCDVRDMHCVDFEVLGPKQFHFFLEMFVDGTDDESRGCV